MKYITLDLNIYGTTLISFAKSRAISEAVCVAARTCSLIRDVHSTLQLGPERRLSSPCVRAQRQRSDSRCEPRSPTRPHVPTLSQAVWLLDMRPSLITKHFIALLC